jgi:hypothetical protein
MRGSSSCIYGISVGSSQVASVLVTSRSQMRSILRRRTASAPKLEGLQVLELSIYRNGDIAIELQYAMTKFRDEQLHGHSH